LIEGYGFSLGDSNSYDSLRVRVLAGLTPDVEITKPSELFPTEKIFEEKNGLEDLTVFLKIKGNKIS